MAKQSYLEGLNKEKKVDMAKVLKNKKYVNMCDHKKLKGGVEITLLEPCGDGMARCKACKHIMPIDVKAKKEVKDSCEEVIQIIDTIKAAMKNPSEKQLDEMANIMLFLQSLPDIYVSQYADMVSANRSNVGSDFEERLETDYMSNSAIYLNTDNSPFGYKNHDNKKKHRNNKNKNKNKHKNNKKQQRGSDIFGLSY